MMYGMRLRLTYRGQLLSGQKSNLAHIHEIRRSFHRQMRACWQLEPLSHQPALLNPTPSETCVIEARKQFVFAPLVSAKLSLTAELNVLFLRAAVPGHLYAGGDIDNRVKTLLDALRMPTLSEINSANLAPQSDEAPFFCLLQDDALVTSLAVTTDSFLDASDRDECLLVISAELHTTKTTFENLALV
jgi:hypothetical protein